MSKYNERKKFNDKQEKQIKQRIDAQPVVEDIIEYIKGEKYRNPNDENERGYNRGIDRAIKMIESEFLY